jgi:hypothetical protein
MKIGSLEPLAELPALQELELRDVLTVHDISPLGTLLQLRKLTINWWAQGFGDAVRINSIRPLAHNGSLEELDLSGTVIEDGDLSPLVGLPALRKVRLYGELGSAVDELRRARPDIEIKWSEPPKPTGKKVGPVYIQPPVPDSDDWWIVKDLTDLLGTSTNYAAETKLKKALKQEDPELLARLDFDTEAGEVVILGKSEKDLRSVAKLIGRLAK